MEKPIRILQRPCQTTSNLSSDSSKPTVSKKTLEQREADYAAARRRIMGADDECAATACDGGLNGANIGNGSAPDLVSRPMSAATATVTTAPLMFIQAAPICVGGASSDVRPVNVSVSPSVPLVSGVQSRVSPTSRQSLATVNVAQKLQQQARTTTNGVHPVTQQQVRVLTASNSSPSLFTHSSRTAQPMALFPAQVNNTANTGLLPTPPGFNYSPARPNPNTNNGVLHPSHSTALTLMQYFGLLQQQPQPYSQPMNGFQHHLIAPAITHANSPLNHLSFQSVASMSNGNQKHSHPSTFN